ncbi:diguanylate cyclase [Sphingomonas floccifaciens]|uniref:diguanylate cyclase n=1 Tax=Sphingomonas floccifaciens TaxID=1844115 RepID=A0ABW4NF80_9SPHN
MGSNALQAPRRSRLATWFGGQQADDPRATAASAQAPDTRAIVERQLYDDIGDFLVRHRLSPMPIHFEIAHAYLTGADPMIAGAIGKMLAEEEGLSAQRISDLIAELRPVESVPQALAQLADQLEERLNECIAANDRSHVSARDYGDALDDAQARLETDPVGTLEHIAGLTRAVVSTTRLVETELKQTRRATEQLRSDLDRARAAAERDHLTGLPNRRGFERRLAELMNAPDADRRRLVVALVDIDDFKRVNDVHGHPAGDRVLKFVGNFLASELGPDICVARYGGEEFAVLTNGRSTHDAVMLLDEVRERLGERRLVNQETSEPIGCVTFSAGAAALTDDIARAMAAADAALYKVKRTGKNAVNMASAS